MSREVVLLVWSTLDIELLNWVAFMDDITIPKARQTNRLNLSRLRVIAMLNQTRFVGKISMEARIGVEGGDAGVHIGMTYQQQ